MSQELTRYIETNRSFIPAPAIRAFELFEDDGKVENEELLIVGAVTFVQHIYGSRQHRADHPTHEGMLENGWAYRGQDEVFDIVIWDDGCDCFRRYTDEGIGATSCDWLVVVPATAPQSLIDKLIAEKGERLMRRLGRSTATPAVPG